MPSLKNKPIGDLFQIRFKNEKGDIDSDVVERKEIGSNTSFDITHIKQHVQSIIEIAPLRPGNGWKISDCCHKAQSILQVFEGYFEFAFDRELSIEKDSAEYYDALRILDSVIDQLNSAKKEIEMHLSYVEMDAPTLNN